MGVMTCDRGDCTNIMCDRCILGNTAYICSECWSELLAYKNTWPETMSVADVRHKIEDFMKTDPGSHVEADVNVEFDRLTRSSDE